MMPASTLPPARRLLPLVLLALALLAACAGDPTPPDDPAPPAAPPLDTPAPPTPITPVPPADRTTDPQPTTTEPDPAPTPQPDPPPATPPPPPTDAPAAPYRLTFAPDEPIDLSPAVVYADIETDEVTVWVLPDAAPEIAVAPSGDFILWWEHWTAVPHLLRMDNGADHVLAADLQYHSVQEFGPNNTGFVAIAGNESKETVVFDRFGQPLTGLQDDGSALTAWAADGRTFAYAWEDTLRVTLLPEAAPDLSQPLFTIPLDAAVGLDWSPDGERLVVVTENIVRAFDRTGDLIWEAEGDFYGNPRWSPNGQLLTVVAANPDVRWFAASDRTYLFNRDGALLSLVPDANTCSGNPWTADSGGFRTVFFFIELDDRTPIDGGYRLTPIVGGHNLQSPSEAALAWAARRRDDGGFEIVLHDSRTSSARVVAVVADGTESLNFVNTANRSRDLIAWTGDGTRILFTVPASGPGGGCLE